MFMQGLTATGSDMRSGTKGTSVMVMPFITGHALAYDFSSSRRPFNSLKISWPQFSMGSFKKMRRARPRPAKQISLSLFEREGKAKTRIAGKEYKTSTIIKFDTGSDCNIVSESFLVREFPGLKYDGEPNQIFARCVSGKALVSKGTVCLDWNCPRSIPPPLGGPYFNARFEKAVFHVMEAEGFELLLGHPDIQRLKIFTINPEPWGIVSTVMTAAQDLGSNVAQEDADAAKRREREKQEVKERKKKNEEKAKKK